MKRLRGYTFVACAAALALSSAVTPATAGSSSTSQLPTQLRSLVNATRAQYGLPRLRRSARLDASALLKAEAIRSCRSFSHTPCGNSFARTFQQTGYFRGNVRVGENLFWGSGGLGTPASAVAAWLKSPPHRANLLGRGWRDVGVGMVYAQSIFGASNVWIFVVQFGRRT
ncbi:MAG: CAP domain-containing protein [Actinobacteria bacterium]|jgi:uncharacterized protein YkwD|nr:MAG: CAP domain-containing protein [Actinomycetota bacterium]